MRKPYRGYSSNNNMSEKSCTLGNFTDMKDEMLLMFDDIRFKGNIIEKGPHKPSAHGQQDLRECMRHYPAEMQKFRPL